MRSRTAHGLVRALPALLSIPWLLPTAACTAPPAAELADTGRLGADVAWLADDAREGRRAGTKAALEAARYIARRFEELGLEPAGEPEGGAPSYFQGFDVPLEPRSGGRSFVESADGSGLPRIDEKPEALLPLFCSGGGEVEGPLVFCGYGIQDESRGRDDLAGLALDGAVALVLRGAPPLPPETATGDAVANPHGAPASGGHGEGDDTRIVDPEAAWGGSATIFMKVMNAKRAGAAAVLLLPDPDEPGEGLLPFEMQSAARAGIPCLSIAWVGRGGLSAGALAQHADDPARATGDAPLLGTRVRVRADVLRGTGPAQNVLARLSGRARRADEPEGTRRTVVVGAHYDHLGFGGTGSLATDGERAVHNGADDNASGTAAVLEIARQLAELREREGPLSGDVVFALWSGEELGLLGSEYWAEHPTVPLDDLRANLNLDMVGRAGDGELNVLGAGTSEAFAGWLGAAGPDAGLTLSVSASGQGVGGSDHQTFLKREIPALHLFSGLHADYHRPTDDVEHVELGGVARVVALSVDVVLRMLDTPELAWTAPPARPEEGRELGSGFRVWFGSIPSYTFEGPGVLFDGISPGSPAEKAGLLPGDVLLAVGDVEIGDIYDFTYALQRYKAGDVVLTRYRRDGEEQDVRMTLASRGIR